MKNTGTRLQVMRGTAKKTSGGLMKKDLMYNKRGKIVSKKKSIQYGGAGSESNIVLIQSDVEYKTKIMSFNRWSRKQITLKCL